MSKNAERLIRDRDRMRKTMDRLTDSLLHELTRRAGTRATGDAKEDGPRSKGGVSDPTLSAVIRSMTRGSTPDPVFDTVRELAHMMDKMAKTCMTIDDKVRFILDSKERAKESQTATCKDCEREVMCTPSDRLRSGLCQACYQASRRQKLLEDF